MFLSSSFRYANWYVRSCHPLVPLCTTQRINLVFGHNHSVQDELEHIRAWAWWCICRVKIRPHLHVKLGFDGCFSLRWESILSTSRYCSSQWGHCRGWGLSFGFVNCWVKLVSGSDLTPMAWKSESWELVEAIGCSKLCSYGVGNPSKTWSVSSSSLASESVVWEHSGGCWGPSWTWELSAALEQSGGWGHGSLLGSSSFSSSPPLSISWNGNVMWGGADAEILRRAWFITRGSQWPAYPAALPSLLGWMINGYIRKWREGKLW